MSSFKPSDIKPKSTPKNVPLPTAVEDTPIKKPFVPKPHLTQRPFRNDALVSLRDGLSKSYRVKQG